ncbi:uncharacterized protein LOC124173119 [Ischnura elegans]|uniref:uncharacterized protein LOC124173119 n=1 Tax=Ischnura elegans TaxID=197161 RepID=UPI001ED8B5E6|nr:uncharacterized protein LOC124173119 [Ischnura elegans]
MSLTRSKRRRRLKNPEKQISDVTLNDFANSDKAVHSEVFRKKVGMKKLIEEVKSLALNLETDCTEEDISPVINDKGTRKRRRKCSEIGKEEIMENDEPEELSSAAVYPLDVWFIIGEYIRPEDVGRFAAICSSSRAVVASPDFWLRLRRRCLVNTYVAEKNTFALRAQVIRALRQSYPPLIARPQFFIRTQTICTSDGNFNSSSSGPRNFSGGERQGTKLQTNIVHRRLLRFTGDHHLVLGAFCMQAWREKRKDNWIYYIKLKQSQQLNGSAAHLGMSFIDNNNDVSSVGDDGTPDCWMSRSTGEEILCSEEEQKKQIGDMWANSEEGCKVIEIMLDKEQLSNGHLGPCPPVLGLSLVWACARQTSSTCASSNSRCLALLFGPPHLSPKAATSLLSKLGSGWQSCGGGWAEPISDAEEISLSCGTPLPKGSKCGVKRQGCCKGGSAVSAMNAAKGLSLPDGMVPVVFPGVTAIRLLDWWDADYPYPGEMRSRGETCGGDDDNDDHGRWMP